MCDIILLMLGEPGLYDVEGPNARDPGSVTERLNAIVKKQLLPVCPSLLDDEDPIPLYTLKVGILRLRTCNSRKYQGLRFTCLRARERAARGNYTICYVLCTAYCVLCTVSSRMSNVQP